jgi:hypothetical protein
MKTSSTHKGNTMQIQLDQAELKEAVRLYVTNELNINLTGKTLTTTFTATRGDAGIITNLSIAKVGQAGEVEIPGFTNAPEEVVAAANTAPAAAEAKVKGASPDKGTVAPVTAAVLTTQTNDAAVVTGAGVALSETEAQTEPAEAAAAEDIQVAGSETEAAAVVVDGAPKATTSLFG